MSSCPPYYSCTPIVSARYMEAYIINCVCVSYCSAAAEAMRMPKSLWVDLNSSTNLEKTKFIISDPNSITLLFQTKFIIIPGIHEEELGRTRDKKNEVELGRSKKYKEEC